MERRFRRFFFASFSFPPEVEKFAISRPEKLPAGFPTEAPPNSRFLTDSTGGGGETGAEADPSRVRLDAFSSSPTPLPPGEGGHFLGRRIVEGVTRAAESVVRVAR